MAEEQTNTQNEQVQEQAPATEATQEAAPAAEETKTEEVKEQASAENTEEPKAEGESTDVVVKDGSKVTLHYTGTLDDGTVFDSSKDREPLTFTVGAQQVIKGFESGSMGLKVGDVKDVKCSPEEAYGERREDMVQEVPRQMFGAAEEQLKAQGQEMQIGMVFGMQSPEGHVMHAKVIEVSDEKVKIDLNHDLAGKTLNFNIEIVKIE